MNTRAENHSSMNNENVVGEILVPSSLKKPQVPDAIQQKWQEITNLVVQALDVTAGIIIRFSDECGEVVAASSASGNLFCSGESIDAATGLLMGIAGGQDAARVIVEVHSGDTWHNNPLQTRGIHSAFVVKLLWEDATLFGTLCAVDTHDKKLASDSERMLGRFATLIEHDLKSLILNEDYKQRLLMQDMLIREAHHRINNHLTLLISYLQLHVAEEREGKELGGVLLDIENRIRSIAVIHEELYSMSADKRGIRFDTYCTKLTRSLIANVGGTAISCTCDIEKLRLPIELAVSLGLIISELVTNAIKYAFTGIASPEIHITMHRITQNRIHLCFHDNGVGLPPGFDFKLSTTLGMNLIKLQVEQLHGAIEVSGKDGTEFCIDIDG